MTPSTDCVLSSQATRYNTAMMACVGYARAGHLALALAYAVDAWRAAVALRDRSLAEPVAVMLAGITDEMGAQSPDAGGGYPLEDLS